MSSAPPSHPTPHHHPPGRHRRAHSVEALPSTTNTSVCSHCSCCSTHGQQPLASSVEHLPTDVSGHLRQNLSSSTGALESRIKHQRKQQSSRETSNKENYSTFSSVVSSRAVTTAKTRSDPGLRVVGVPFKDRTNIQESGQSKKTKKIGSLKELVPPLNAARLRPLQQQTRGAMVSHKLLFSYSFKSPNNCCGVKIGPVVRKLSGREFQQVVFPPGRSALQRMPKCVCSCHTRGLSTDSLAVAVQRQR